jgi:hypothetical protein
MIRLSGNVEWSFLVRTATIDNLVSRNLVSRNLVSRNLVSRNIVSRNLVSHTMGADWRSELHSAFPITLQFLSERTNGGVSEGVSEGVSGTSEEIRLTQE